MAPEKRASRRKVLQTATVLSLGGLAGCSGDGDGGDDTPAPDDDTPAEESTPTATPEPEPYTATSGGVGRDLGIVPFLAAHIDLLPEATNDLYRGEYQQFSSGRLVMQSVVSGDIQLYTGGLGAIYQAAAAGADLRVIMPLQKGTDYVFAIRENVSGLSAFTEQGNDLQVGISGIGALSHTMAVGAFLSEDLPVENVNWVEVGGSSTRTNSVAAGNVDATPIHRGQFERLKSAGAGVKEGANLAELYPNFIQAGLTVRQRELDRHPEYYQALANQVAVSNQRTNEDFDWIFNKTQKFQAQPLSEDDARTTWQVNKDVGAWATSPIGLEPYQAVYDMMTEGGILDADIDLEHLIADDISSTAFENLG